MTKISYVSGIAPTGQTVQSGQSIAPPQYINYLGLSEGQLLTTLGRENMKILATTYPNSENTAAWQRNIERADAFLKGSDYKVAAVQTEVEREFNHFLDTNRRKTYTSFVRGIGDLEDCGNSQGYWDFDNDRTDGSMVFYPANPDWYNCMQRNARAIGIEKAINDYLDRCGHNVMYLFIPNLNDVPNLVAQKGYEHKKFLSEIQRLSGLSEDAALLWIRNGIQRHNAIKGIGALTPEQCIALLYEGKDEDGLDIYDQSKYPHPTQIRIGVLDPITIAAITGLIKVIVAGLTVTFAFIIALKEKDGTAFATTALAALGTDKITPNPPDFKKGGTTGGGSDCPTGYTKNTSGICEKDEVKSEGLSTKTMILIGGGIAAAAGLILLSSDNKKA